MASEHVSVVSLGEAPSGQDAAEALAGSEAAGSDFADMVDDDDLELLGMTVAPQHSSKNPPVKAEIGGAATSSTTASSSMDPSAPPQIEPHLDGDAAVVGGRHGEDPGDDAMFAELFGENGEPMDVVAAIGEGKDEAAPSRRRCSVCGSTHSDIDLAGPSGSRSTPFVRMRADSNIPICDHCEMMLRYQEGDKGVSAGSLLKSFADSADAKAKYMRRLACYLALKRSEKQSKIHKVTLTSTVVVMEAFVAVAEALSARSASLAPEVGKPRYVLGLRNFVQKFGNSLNLGVDLRQALVHVQCQIVAITDSTIPTGRHSLAQVVAQSAGELKSETIGSLQKMSVDSVDDVRLVKHLVSEHACRVKWQQELLSLDTGAAPQPPESSGSGAGDTATVVSPPSTRPAPHSATKASLASLSDRCGVEDGASESGASRVKAESPARRRSRCTATAGHPSPPPHASASADFETPTKGLAVASAAAAPLVSGSPLSRSSEGVSPISHAPASVSSDKAFDRLVQRSYDVCRIFAAPSWRKHIRGKPKAIEYIQRSMNEFTDTCRAQRKEDRLPFLDHLAQVLLACLKMHSAGRRKSPDQFDLLEMWEPIHLVAEFIHDCRGRYASADGEILNDEIVPSFKKVEVAAPAPHRVNNL